MDQLVSSILNWIGTPTCIPAFVLQKEYILLLLTTEPFQKGVYTKKINFVPRAPNSSMKDDPIEEEEKDGNNRVACFPGKNYSSILALF